MVSGSVGQWSVGRWLVVLIKPVLIINLVMRSYKRRRVLEISLISAHSKGHNGFLNLVSYNLIDMTDGCSPKKENIKQYLNRRSIH